MFFYPSVSMFFYPSVSVFFYPSVFLSVCLRVFLPVCLRVFLPVCLHVFLPVCLHVFLPVCLRVFLPVCLHVFLPVCLHVFLPVCLSTRLSPCFSTRLSPCFSTRLSPCFSTRLSQCFSTRLSFYPSVSVFFYPSVSVFFYPSVSVFFYPSVFLPVCLSTRLSFYPSVFLPVCLRVFLPVCLHVFLPVCLHVFLPDCLCLGGKGWYLFVCLCVISNLQSETTVDSTVSVYCLSSSFSTRLSSCFSTRLCLLGGRGGFCSSVCVSFSTLQSETTVGSTVSVYCLSSSFSTRLSPCFSTRLSLLGGRGGICSSVSVSFLPFSLKRRWVLQYLSTCLSSSFSTRLSSCFSTRLCLLVGRGGFCSSVCVSFSTLQSETTVGSTVSVYCLSSSFSTRLSSCFSTRLSLLGGRDGFCSSVCVSFSTLQSETTVGSTVSVYCLSSSFSTRLSSCFSTRLSLLGGSGGFCSSVSVSFSTLQPGTTVSYTVSVYCLSSSFSTRLSSSFSTRLSLLGGKGWYLFVCLCVLFYPSVWNDGGFYSICLLSVFVFFYATVSVGGKGWYLFVCLCVFSTLQSETTVGSTCLSTVCLRLFLPVCLRLLTLAVIHWK